MSNKYPNSKIDIILLSCNRKENTKETIDKLYERVLYPNKIRLIVVDNCSVDGTYKLLQEYKKKGKIDVLMSSPEESTISEAYNLGFKSVKSNYFICMQDDITVPMFKDKDVIERLQELLDKYPEQSGIGCRIQRIPNMHWTDGDISPARKALSAYFRIQRREDFIKMGMLNPKKSWDDFNFVNRVRDVLKKDCSWANNLWADHSRGYCKDRGYKVKPRKWGTGIHSREHQDWIEKPYPEIDPITNIPLKLLKNYTNSIKGWMRNDDLQWLYETAKKMDNIVEIGSWKGRSTHALLSGCKGTVYAVDHFLGSETERETSHKEAKEGNIYKDFLDNVGHFSNLRTYRMDSLEAAKKFDDNSVDMIFIDAGHNYNEVARDIKAWSPKAKKIVCGHDYPIKRVRNAVKDTLGEPIRNNKNGNIWIIKK